MSDLKRWGDYTEATISIGGSPFVRAKVDKAGNIRRRGDRPFPKDTQVVVQIRGASGRAWTMAQKVIAPVEADYAAIFLAALASEPTPTTDEHRAALESYCNDIMVPLVGPPTSPTH